MRAKCRASSLLVAITVIAGSWRVVAQETCMEPTTLRLDKQNSYVATFPPFHWNQRGTIRVSISWNILGDDSINVLHRVVLLNPMGKEVARVERLLNSAPAKSTIVYSPKSSDMLPGDSRKEFWPITALNVDPSMNKRVAAVTVEVQCSHSRSKNIPPH